MTPKRFRAATLAIAIGLASSAWAATISTPVVALPTPLGGSCLVVNAGTSPIDVNVAFVDQDANVEQSYDLTIPAESVGFQTFLSPIAAARAFCRVEGKFSAKKVKVSFRATGSDAYAVAP